MAIALGMKRSPKSRRLNPRFQIAAQVARVVPNALNRLVTSGATYAPAHPVILSRDALVAGLRAWRSERKNLKPLLPVPNLWGNRFN